MLSAAGIPWKVAKAGKKDQCCVGLCSQTWLHPLAGTTDGIACRRMRCQSMLGDSLVE